MKTQKGFIQTPLLIAIIVGVLVLGGAGYFGVKQYQKSQQENIVKEQQAQEQQKALEQAQAEIDKLKLESELTQTKQKQLEQKVSSGNQTTGLTISSSELASYLSSIVKVSCSTRTVESTGSGTFWKYGNLQGVLTNDHVPLSDASYCTASWPYDEAKGQIRGDHFLFFPGFDLDWNKKTDATFIDLTGDKSGSGLYITDMNYGVYNLRRCPAKMAIGLPVVIIGYPASTQTDTTYPRTITNGIISGWDQSVQPPQGTLPYVNYFVSNKIDSGNSGGIALSKDTNGLCVLGIPTWLQVGNYDTQGIIQNILNVLSKQ
jgi:S1-C subfamily serine protease